MTDSGAAASLCGIDSVEIARIERLLAESAPEHLERFFSAQELSDAGEGPGRAASLAARFAAKEACLKLFPREAALGRIEPTDFSVARDNYGAPQVECSERARYVMDLHRIGRIALSLTHDRASASAVALAERAPIDVPAYGRWIHRFFPLRREVILGNLRRVFGATLPPADIVSLAQAHYGHLLELVGEFAHHRWMSRERKNSLGRRAEHSGVRAALEQRKGVLVLTGHFGNWEVSTTAAIAKFPEMHGKFHFVRPRDQARLARSPGQSPLQPGGLRRVSETRLARRDARAPGERRSDRLSIRPARRGHRMASRSIFSASRVDIQEPRDHRARHRRTGAARGELAGGERPTRACASASRCRRSRRRIRMKRSVSIRGLIMRPWNA
jgi:phosphopantetheine--protein transferase-like protein